MSQAIVEALPTPRTGPRSRVSVMSYAARLALPVALLAIWQIVTSIGWVEPFLMPSPLRVAETLYQLIASGQLLRHVGASFLRVSQGFSIAATTAFAIGLAMAVFPPVTRLADLLIQVLKPIPPIAWIPLAILWFGIGEQAKVFIIVLGAFFPILVSTVEALRQVDRRFVELARVLEVGRGDFVRKILIPSALPQIMTGLRLGFAYSWMCVVAAELIAASKGLGYLIMDGRELSQVDLVLAGMLTLGVVGKLSDDGLRVVERRLIRWRTTFAGY
ncbi:ABC transporter permease [Siculibacillus lacustris]|nr:ABC transporter permease [Siculibacillus lacustris]